MRFIGILAVSAVIAVVAATPVAAQSNVCTAIRAELAALDGRGSSDGGSAQALRQEIARTRIQMRRAGCSGFFRRGGRSCGRYVSHLNRLERELSRSSRRGFSFFGRRGVDRERDRLRRALSRYGCSEGGGYGTYRTICVRVCDGYYFPLNFSTSRQRISADAQKCVNQYGPGEAMLFYHPSPRGDASQAVAISGERYVDQPYAFAYRAKFHPQCAAQLHEGVAALGSRVLAGLRTLPEPALSDDQKPPTMIPAPIARVEPSSDPETAANRAGRFAPAAIDAGSGGVVVAAGGTAMRTVGDPYIVAPSTPGSPPTVPGYKPPELRDFRTLLKARMLPDMRSPEKAPDL